MSKQTWKTLLKQHNQLKASSAATLFDRVSLLAKIWADPQYKIDQQKSGKPVMELLNNCVSDTCANASELIQMLKMFPRKLQWAGGDLSVMRGQMLRKLVCQTPRGKSNKGQKQPHSRTVITRVQYHVLEEENARLKEQVRHLEEELQLARETIRALTSNKRLVA
jgi:hypothetical protein